MDVLAGSREIMYMDHSHHHSMEAVGQSHDRHVGHSPAMFRQKFWLSLVFTIPTILYSQIIQGWLGFSMPEFLGYEYIPAIFGSVLFFYSGTVFIKGGIAEINRVSRE